ncbi:MAG: M14 family metallopeptidase [candidate division KSB1 bacterium]|nr:M14 family metallopeptidase [candidate division KSB1 bacterium]
MMAQRLLVLMILFSGCMLLANPFTGAFLNEQQKRLQALQKHDRATLESVAATPGGHPLWTLTVAAKDTGLPAVVLFGNVDGDDPASTELVLGLLERWLHDYDRVDSITQFLDSTVIYAFPNINPDAQQGSLPLNARSLDLDHDGFKDEDAPEDINGDGFITHMRILDPAGAWMADSSLSGWMRKADPARGEYGAWRVYREGVDNDADGRWNEDSEGGVHINRNFSYQYPRFEFGAGLDPMSEPETRAIADFVFEHENIVAMYAITRAGNLVQPWSSAGDGEPNNVAAEDKPYFESMADRFQNIAGKPAWNSEQSSGRLDHWAYFHAGRWCFSAPVWVPRVAADSADTGDWPPEKRLWTRIEEQNDSSRFVPWQPVQHPDFPDKRVEVGGLKPYADQPDAADMDSLIDVHHDFLLELRRQLPYLQVETHVEPLGSGIFRVRLCVQNRGALPTQPLPGTDLRWNRDLTAQLEWGEGQILLSHEPFIKLPRLEPGEAHELSWLLQGSEPVSITVGSPSCGFISKRLSLRKGGAK